MKYVLHMYKAYCLSKLPSISNCIKSNLALLILTARCISQPISCKLTSCSSPTITEIHNFIITANYISPIDPLPLNVFKNLVHTLKYLIILDLIYKSLDDGIKDKSLTYAIIKPILKKTYLDPNVLTNYRSISQLPIISNIMECILSRQIIYYLEANNLIEPSRLLTGSYIQLNLLSTILYISTVLHLLKSKILFLPLIIY